MEAGERVPEASIFGGVFGQIADFCGKDVDCVRNSLRLQCEEIGPCYNAPEIEIFASPNFALKPM
jgi:hypothetical protein